MEHDVRVVRQYKILRYESAKHEYALKLFQEGVVNGVDLYPCGGFKDENLDFLLHLEKLRAVCIQSLPKISLSLLEELSSLEYLTIDQETIESTKFTLNFSKLSSLKSLATTWHKKLFRNPESANLESLYLWKYKPTSNNLTDFPQFNQLKLLDPRHSY